MNKNDYKEMMNSIEPNPEARYMIYQNINKKTSKKKTKTRIGLACVVASLILSFCYISNKSLSKNPFVVEVYAKDGVKTVSLDTKKSLEIQNKAYYEKDGKKYPFRISGYDTEKESFSYLLLTLPIRINGENIQSISFKVNNENASFIPRFSLENYISITGKTDEEIFDEIRKICCNLPDKERQNYDKCKTYSEMTEEGKKVFKEYVEFYKKELLNNDWVKDQKDLYNDDYTSHILLIIHFLTLKDFTDSTLEEQQYHILRKLRLDEHKYFIWGRDFNTKVATYDYDKFVNDDMNMQVAIYNPDFFIPDSVLLEELEKTSISMKVFFDDSTMCQKTIRFQNINENTGTYTLVIE